MTARPCRRGSLEPRGSRGNVRRSRVLTSLIAVASLTSTGVFLLGTPRVEADTANPDIASEGWYPRYKQEDPQVEVPCVPPQVPVPSTVPPQGCGPVSPADFPAPQSKGTGHYVVSSRAGDIGDHDTGADTGWAAFQWDLLAYEGASADKFVVTLTQGQDNSGRNQGDTYPNTPAPIQACNILEGWSAEPGSNPWVARPKVSSSCVVPTVSADGKSFTFDVTDFADTWLKDTGFGFVIRPGTPTTRTIQQPFQLTFSGYYDTPTSSASCNGGATAPGCTTTKPVLPKVTFEYTPAVEDDSFGSTDDDFGGGDVFEDVTITDGGTLEAVPDLDVIPTDVGSDPDPVADAGGGALETSGETTSVPLGRGRSRPISSEPGFPWIVLLLLPLAAIAFWGTGTALGAVGDPVPARAGGVSRVLAERHAAQRGSNFETRI